MNKVKLGLGIVVLGVLAFYYFQDPPSTSSNELVDVKIYEVKDVVHQETHKTRDRDYNIHNGRVKNSFNEHYYYDIYLSNPSKYPDITKVYEEYQYKTDGFISDNWRDDEGNEGYAVFEIYKDNKTDELKPKLVEVRNDKKGAEIVANMRLDGIKN
ncbi:hypothetical protein [Neobacillus dielmonensis]|uniref:hypothetical protein n=1 Tax=Neobacillus dielmonensis TaxID=1347369 RepID=UPI0005A62D71|nr:hypothetical protein [Neobacillus dielmonensis]